MGRGRKGGAGYIELAKSFGIQISPEQALSLAQIFEEYEQNKEIIIITHPSAGGSANFPAGTSVIDFYDGTVTYADGTTADLSNNLEALQEQWMRSLFLETDQTIQISLDDGRTYYQIVQGDYIGLTWQEFQRIYIKVTTAADISLWATTNPEAVLNKLKADSARTSAIYRQLTSALDCSTGTVTLSTSFVANFEIAGIFVKFSAAVSPTVNLYRVSTLGTNYKTLLRSTTLAAAQNVYYQFAKGEGRVTAGDVIQLEITTCAAIAYTEILTEDV